MVRGKVVVITGASNGIGQTAAVRLAKKGAQVVLSARRIDPLKETVRQIERSGGQASFYVADVTRRDNMEGLARHAFDTYGCIDVWINNAGLGPLSFLNKIKVDEWDAMVDVNIKGVLYGIAAVLPIMESQQSGHIINISSVAGHRIGMAGAVYSATKFAVRAITEGLRMEASSTAHIRTTLISPGIVNTEFNSSITDDDALLLVASRAIVEPLRPEDIANAIIYAVNQPERMSINEILVRPTTQPH